MLLSKSCVYGIRASLYIAAVAEEGYIPIHEISEKLKISSHFLTKILQQLTSEQIMESFRGPKGGVRLARPGNEVSLMAIVLAIDGPKLLMECALGLPGCGVAKPCPLHNKWAQVRDSIQDMLENTTLNELVGRMKQEDLRIAGQLGWNDVAESS